MIYYRLICQIGKIPECSVIYLSSKVLTVRNGKVIKITGNDANRISACFKSPSNFLFFKEDEAKGTLKTVLKERENNNKL